MLTSARPGPPAKDGASVGLTLLKGEAGTMRLIGSSAACGVAKTHVAGANNLG